MGSETTGGKGTPAPSGSACPRCGGKVPAPAADCPHCGVLFSKLRRTAAERPTPSRSEPGDDPPVAVESGPSLLGWLALAVLVGGAVLAWPRSEPRDILPSRRAGGAEARSPAPASAARTESAAGLDAAPPPALPPVRSGTTWYEGAGGLERALAEARGGGFPLAVYFYLDGSPECRQLKHEVLDARPVVDFFRGFVKVEINPEGGVEERAVADAYGAQTYPAVFVLPKADLPPQEISRWQMQADGEERLKTPEDFVAVCRLAIGG